MRLKLKAAGNRIFVVRNETSSELESWTIKAINIAEAKQIFRDFYKHRSDEDITQDFDKGNLSIVEAYAINH